MIALQVPQETFTTIRTSCGRSRHLPGLTTVSSATAHMEFLQRCYWNGLQFGQESGLVTSQDSVLILRCLGFLSLRTEPEKMYWAGTAWDMDKLGILPGLWVSSLWNEMCPRSILWHLNGPWPERLRRKIGTFATMLPHESIQKHQSSHWHFIMKADDPQCQMDQIHKSHWNNFYLEEK